MPLKNHHMEARYVQSCIDNGPMEGFWGILKRECIINSVLTIKFLITAIVNYIDYYNNERLQRKLRNDTQWNIISNTQSGAKYRQP